MTAPTACGHPTPRQGPQHRPASTPALALFVVVGLAAALLALAPATDAGAATNAVLEHEAAAISARLATNESHLSTIGGEYIAAREHEAAADLLVDRSQRAIGELDRRIAEQRRALYHSAVAFYVAGDETMIDLYISGRTNEVMSGEAYLRVATNELEEGAVALSDTRDARMVALTHERAEAADSRVALAEALQERAAARATVDEEANVLGSVKGQLAALVAAEQAAHERAVAAAQAAQASAARRGGGGAAPGAGPPAAVATVSATTSPIPAGSLARAFAGIRQCESGDVYTLNTGNGYYGAYQFSLGTWADLGGAGLPSAAPAALQDGAAYRLYRSSGFAAWPECAAILGL